MKILILSLYYSPDLCAGAFRCAALVEKLEQLAGPDCAIEVLTTMPNRYESFKVYAAQFEQHKGLTIQRIALPSNQGGLLNQVKTFIYYAKTVNKLTSSANYSLVFATSGRLMTAVLGAWVARKKKAKLYLDIRDIFVSTISDIFPTSVTLFIKPVFGFLEKWALTRADRINLVSKGFRPYFNKRYPKAKFSWFTNGVDTEFTSIVSSLIQPVKNTNGRLTVLYAGNIGEGQGLDQILPYLAKRFESSMDFRIIGDGGRRVSLANAIKKYGCLNIELLAPVNRDILIQEYQKADILFLHLADYEVFREVLPSKLFEYAATGKPIWAGVSGYSAEFVKAEISNAVVFNPCNVLQAEEVLANLKLCDTNRTEFIGKFSRGRIMHEMAADLLSLI